MSALAGWENFYVIVGSSAGALIGLQFVVVTLLADMPLGPDAALAGEAFGTPTVVHFGVALLLSAIASAPWHDLSAAASCWGIVAVGGLLYSVVTIWRMSAQTVYRPQREDWVFYAVLPLVAYIVLGVSAFEATSAPSTALFAVAATTLLLLFIGIRNSWDSVTYHVFVQRREHREREKQQS